MYQEIKESLRNLYLDDPRPWLVGFSGGKDSTLVAALIFEVLCEIPEHQRVKPISILCTDTRVEIPAIAEMVEGTLGRMQKFSRQNKLNIDINLLSPPSEQSFWVTSLVVVTRYPTDHSAGVRNALPCRSYSSLTQPLHACGSLLRCRTATTSRFAPLTVINDSARKSGGQSGSLLDL